jgi:hypothetical protein
MLNLNVRLMKRHLLPLLILFLIAAQDSPPVAITSPGAGDILIGEVSIIGSTDAQNFASAELDFKYASDPADTWFLLQTFTQPARETPLYLWKTTAITDGEYILRLRVDLLDGASREVTIPVTIQNDAPLSTQIPAITSTPEPEASFVFQAPTPFFLAVSPTSTEVPRPTPTPLPPNPASLDRQDILGSLSRGALVIAGLFVFAGILLRFRRA